MRGVPLNASRGVAVYPNYQYHYGLELDTGSTLFTEYRDISFPKCLLVFGMPGSRQSPEAN